MADRISDLRKIQVTPNRWRRSVQAAEDGAGVSLTELENYPRMEALNGGQNLPRLEFVFPFPPTQVSYDQISPELVEVQRAGRKPLIFFAKDRATRVRFQILIAVPRDGLFIDVEESLGVLQELATSARPVVFYNIDKFLGAPSSVGSLELTFWSIMDLSFESVRRNAGQRITSATASISLVENTNPFIEVIDLPDIQYTVDVPAQAQPSGNAEEDDLPNFIDYITIDNRTGTSSLSSNQ